MLHLRHKRAYILVDYSRCLGHTLHLQHMLDSYHTALHSAHPQCICLASHILLQLYSHCYYHKVAHRQNVHYHLFVGVVCIFVSLLTACTSVGAVVRPRSCFRQSSALYVVSGVLFAVAVVYTTGSEKTLAEIKSLGITRCEGVEPDEYFSRLPAKECRVKRTYQKCVDGSGTGTSTGTRSGVTSGSSGCRNDGRRHRRHQSSGSQLESATAS